MPRRWLGPGLGGDVDPVLCLAAVQESQPVPDNLFVRFIKASYLKPLGVCLKYRWLTVLFYAGFYSCTVWLLLSLGHEFMPELEEGNLWIRGTAPLNTSLARQRRSPKNTCHHGLLPGGR